MRKKKNNTEQSYHGSEIQMAYFCSHLEVVMERSIPEVVEGTSEASQMGEPFI